MGVVVYLCRYVKIGEIFFGYLANISRI